MAHGDDILEAVALLLESSLTQHGIEGNKATAIAIEVCELLRGHWGSQKLYIAKGVLRNSRKRQAEIFAKFDGTNYTALAMEYGVTEMRIRQIVTAARAERKKQRAEQECGTLEGRVADADADDLIEDARALIEAALKQQGIDDSNTATIASTVSDSIREQRGGVSFYVANRMSVSGTYDKRNLEIFSRFTGENHTELAEQYGLTVMRIHQIVRAVKAKQRDKQERSDHRSAQTTEESEP